LPALPAPFEVGILASQASLGEQHRRIGGSCGGSQVPGSDQHVGKPRLQRERSDRATVGRDAAVAVDRAEAGKTGARSIERRKSRKLGKR
jgi:hypothetical protein